VCLQCPLFSAVQHEEFGARCLGNLLLSFADLARPGVLKGREFQYTHLAYKLNSFKTPATLL